MDDRPVDEPVQLNASAKKGALFGGKKYANHCKGGNSKPFYKHLIQTKQSGDSHMKLVNPKGKTVVEASQCAEILKKIF